MDNERNELLVAPPSDEDPIILGAIREGFPLEKIEIVIKQYYEETGRLFRTLEPLLDRLRVYLICELSSVAFEAVFEVFTSLFEKAVD